MLTSSIRSPTSGISARVFVWSTPTRQAKNNGRRLEHLKSYLNVFPTLFLGFNPNDRHAFSLNGTVRLNRPHFGQLSPFASYENQYSIMRGKEDLRAAKRAQLALGYTFLGVLDSSSTVVISGMASHRSSA